MKAMNLLPPEQRHAGEVRLRGSSPATLALLGALVFGVLVAAAFVVLSNRVATQQSQLAEVQTQVTVAQASAAKLQKYGDLVAKRDAAVQQVTQLADSRYDWAGVLSHVARALPANVSLTTFGATLSGSSSAATTTPGTAASAPTISINGCTDSHTAAGRVMQRLRSIDGVTDVSLESSTISATTSSSSASDDGCGRAETFQLTVTLKAPPAPPTTATSTPSATTATAPTTTTPTATASVSGGS